MTFTGYCVQLCAIPSLPGVRSQPGVEFGSLGALSERRVLPVFSCSVFTQRVVPAIVIQRVVFL